MPDLNQFSPEQFRQCLTQVTATTHDLADQWFENESQQAAVLIPIVRNLEQWHLLYIRRAEHEKDHHSGQVAFAGGKYEQQDVDLQTTALREASEEIGIHAGDVTILGELGFHRSITGFQITPVVGHIPWPYDLTLDEKEVARVFTIPLQWLADPDNHRIENRQLIENESFPVIFFNEYDGEVLWGATARMTLSLISLLKLPETNWV